MISPESITPGFLSESAAETLREAINATEQNEADIILLQTVQIDDFPAKITAYDAPSTAYSWSEQYYDASGRRIDYPGGGRVGTSTYSPAYACGNGIPPTVFPVEVWLRRRVSTAIGPVYEFDWNCSCGSTYSGGGGGGGGTIQTDCCPDMLPATLYLIFGTGVFESFPPVTLTFGGGAWVGTLEACSGTVTFSWACTDVMGTPTWVMTTSGAATNTTDVTLILNCNPFLVNGGSTITSADPGCVGTQSYFVAEVSP